MGAQSTQGFRGVIRKLRYPEVPPPSPDFGTFTARTHSGVEFRPLILGGDMGGMSQARSFHEAYGCRSQIVAQSRIPQHSASSMFEISYEPHLNEEKVLVGVVNAIADLAPTPVLVTTSFDLYVSILAAHRDQLRPNVVVPYVGHEVIDLITNKANFARLAHEVGMAHPDTIIHRIGDGAIPDLSELGLPVIAKPAIGDEHDALDFEGREKVYILANRAEIDALDATLQDAGFKGDFVFQRRVAGSDAQMRILTCYVDQDHQVRISAFGRVLIEEHDPQLRGNPAVILTGEDSGDSAAQAARLLERIKWVGYANFDIKVDPRTGDQHFFELNPRLGRSNYYLNVAGVNPVEVLAEAWVGGVEPEPRVAGRAGMYTVVPVSLALLYGIGQRGRILAALLTGRVRNPLVAWRERTVSRNVYALAASLHQFHRFRQHYPLSRFHAERKDGR